MAQGEMTVQQQGCTLPSSHHGKSAESEAFRRWTVKRIGVVGEIITKNASKASAKRGIRHHGQHR